MTRAKDISKIITDADFSGTLDVAGDLTVDTDTLHVDSTNNRVGIGTSSPSAKLHISKGSSGGSVNASADDLVIESNTTAGINILTNSAASGNGVIYFGDENDNNVGYLIYNHTDNALLFGANAGERMRIDSSGNVGIGTDSPDDLLHVRATAQTGASLRLENSSTSTDANTVYGTINFEGNDASAGASGIRGSIVGGSDNISGGMSLEFSTAAGNSSNTERMRITSAGKVGIGTSSPNVTLHVQGANASSGDANHSVVIDDTTSMAQGVGGGIVFRGNYGSGLTNGGFIQTEKSNGTSGNYAFDLVLGSRTNGSSPAERMRIDSSGDFLFLGGTLRIKDSGNTAQRGAIYGSASEFHLNSGVDNMVLTTSGGEAMRIRSDGNVGLNTSNPTTPLFINKGFADHTSTAITLQNSLAGGYGGQIIFKSAQSNGILLTAATIGTEGTAAWNSTPNTDSALKFSTIGDGTLAERIRITSDGNVGIGTSNPSTARLQVREDTNTSDTLQVSSQLQFAGQYHDLAIGIDDFYAVGMRRHLTTSTPSYLNPRLDFFVQNHNTYLKSDRGVKMTLHNNGAINVQGVYDQTTSSGANVNVASDGHIRRSTSSLRYKNTINDATHGLTELLTLRPVTYKGNNDGDTVFGGLIAEEVHTAGLTEFVQYNDDDQPDALAYGNMVSLCIKAIQELKTELDSAKARITTLENA